jgi:hypothetical protein
VATGCRTVHVQTTRLLLTLVVFFITVAAPAQSAARWAAARGPRGVDALLAALNGGGERLEAFAQAFSVFLQAVAPIARSGPADVDRFSTIAIRE